MKQFLYLDYDIVNSIIAQNEKGLITDFAREEEINNSSSHKNSSDSEVEANIEGGMKFLAQAGTKFLINKINDDERNTQNIEKDIISKTLHDAAFDISYDYIHPHRITMASNSEYNDYGNYVELARIYDVIDLDYIEKMLNNKELMKLVGLDSRNSTNTNGANRTQRRNSQNTPNSTSSEMIKKATEAIKALKGIISSSRMLFSDDGYLIPLEDKYFRIDPSCLGFKYGGEITCVGMITNIIGESTKPIDGNMFSNFQFQINESIRAILPTNDSDICVVHPIAIYYNGNILS